MPLFVRLKEGVLPLPPLVMEDPTDPEASAKSRARRERFDRNVAHFKRHAEQVYKQHAGKVVCIAGEEIFAGDTAAEAKMRASAVHPDDDGPVVVSIPRQRTGSSATDAEYAPSSLSWQKTTMLKPRNLIEIVEETLSPEESAKTQAQREEFDRNSAWLQAHIPEVYSHRGKFVCIAGEELFVGATVQEAIAHAVAAHPNEEGWFTRYIPKEKAFHIYAH
jgi:hypothetical protein